jgi:SAM-dependent methyltransferase
MTNIETTATGTTPMTATPGDMVGKQPSDMIGKQPSDHPDGRAWDSWYAQHGMKVIASGTRDVAADAIDARNALLHLADLSETKLIAAKATEQQNAVLEIGCGLGRISQLFFPLCTNFVGLDVSQQALNDFPNTDTNDCDVTLICGGAASLAMYKLPSFDLIYACAVLQHVSDCEEVTRYISESVRLLNNGGVALLQFRKAGTLGKVRDFAIDSARVLMRRPGFSKNWRGCRPSRAEVERIAQSSQAGEQTAGTKALSLRWYESGLHDWLIVRKI